MLNIKSYNYTKKYKKEAERFLDSTGLFVDELDFIIFKGQDVYIRVAEFPFEDLRESRLSANEMIEQMDQIKTMLQRVYQRANLYKRIYRHYPKKLREFIYNLAENNDDFLYAKQNEKRLAKLIALN